MGFFSRLGSKAKETREKYDSFQDKLQERKMAQMKRRTEMLKMQTSLEQQRAKLAKAKAAQQRKSQSGLFGGQSGGAWTGSWSNLVYQQTPQASQSRVAARTKSRKAKRVVIYE